MVGLRRHEAGHRPLRRRDPRRHRRRPRTSRASPASSPSTPNRNAVKPAVVLRGEGRQVVLRHHRRPLIGRRHRPTRRLTEFLQHVVNGLSRRDHLRPHRPGLHDGLRRPEAHQLRPRRRVHGRRPSPATTSPPPLGVPGPPLHRQGGLVVILVAMAAARRAGLRHRAVRLPAAARPAPAHRAHHRHRRLLPARVRLPAPSLQAQGRLRGGAARLGLECRLARRPVGTLPRFRPARRRASSRSPSPGRLDGAGRRARLELRRGLVPRGRRASCSGSSGSSTGPASARPCARSPSTRRWPG